AFAFTATVTVRIGSSGNWPIPAAFELKLTSTDWPAAFAAPSASPSALNTATLETLPKTEASKFNTIRPVAINCGLAAVTLICAQPPAGAVSDETSRARSAAISGAEMRAQTTICFRSEQAHLPLKKGPINQRPDHTLTPYRRWRPDLARERSRQLI